MKFIICIALISIASAAQVSHHDQEIPILRQASDINVDGSYQYSYETGNGIIAQESGVGGHSAQGSAQWTAPDGTPIQLSYVADENGFQPQGAHLPTSPPIPEAIVRALEWIRTHPQEDEYAPKVAGGKRF